MDLRCLLQVEGHVISRDWLQIVLFVVDLSVRPLLGNIY